MKVTSEKFLVLAASLTMIWILLFAPYPLHVKAQAPSGYTLLANVTSGTTYTDSTCPDSDSCNYAVTAVNAVGESKPSNIVVEAIPATGSHNVNLSWTAGTGGGVVTSYNVYRGQVPNPPTGLTGAVQ